MDWSRYLVDRTDRPIRRTLPLERAFEVVAVYPGSLAEAAGIEPGFLYFPRDRENVDPLYLEDLKQKLLNLTVFADLEHNVEIEMRTKGFPFGLKMRRSVEGICADLARGSDDCDEFFDRIHDGDDTVFAKLVATLEAPFKTPGLSTLKSVFSKAQAEPIRERPAVMQMAAGVYYALMGDVTRARRLMEAFETEDFHNRIANSLYAFGQAAIAKMEEAEADEVNEWLERAYRAHPRSARIRDALTRQTGTERPEPDRPFPRPFPLNYYLLERDPLFDVDPMACEFINLNRTLSELDDNQFLLVITLSTYRGNGYYVGTLIQFILLHHLIYGNFPMIHVITGYEKGDRMYPEWLAGEEILKNAEIPIKILHDPEHFVPSIVDAAGSPYSLIVNKDGTIIYEGDLDKEEGYWAALASLEQPAPA